MKTQHIFQILLLIGIIIVGYLLFDSIRKPIVFQKEVNKRREATIQRLKDIREVQNIFRNVYGRYTSSLDTLIEFINNGQIPIVKITADPKDTTFSVFIYDTIGYIAVRDSLFKTRPDFHSQNLRYIPFSNNVEFEMKSGKIESRGVVVNVIEVFAANKFFLNGLDLKQHNIDPNDGLKFGSMLEPTTDGNWE